MYDIQNNLRFVNVGRISHDTVSFVVASIKNGGKKMGCVNFRESKKVFTQLAANLIKISAV